MDINREDVYTRVTNQIVAAIEAGGPKCRMPWHITGEDCFCPINAVSNRPYRGVNVLSLWVAAVFKGYDSGIWATYKQWQELGAQVRKGEQSTTVVLWKPTERTEKSAASEAIATEEHCRRGLFARGFSVFNAAQVDGYQRPARPQLAEDARIRGVEQMLFGVSADIRHGGGKAFYNIEADQIHLPKFATFRNSIGYYSTLAHELVHNAASRIMPRRSEFSLEKPRIDADHAA